MSLGGQDQAGIGDFMGQLTPQVIVYGPDGRMYNNPAQAEAAGVENPTFQPPVMPSYPVELSKLNEQETAAFANSDFTPMPGPPSGGKGGAMQPRLMPVGQPFQSMTPEPIANPIGGNMQPSAMPMGQQPFFQPSRSFGGLNRFMPAGSMNQYQTPMAMPMSQFGQGGVMDPTAMAQQAILARPMRPSFTGQPLMSREVPLGIQGNAGLAYPSMASTGLLNVPSYTSRYAGADSGGGGGSYGGGQTTTGGGLDTYGSVNSLSNGLVGALMGNLASPSYGITVENMGTYANQPSFGMGSAASGIGIPGEDAAAEAAAANNVAAGLAAAQEAADIAAANQSNSFSGSFGSEAGPAAGLSNEAGSTDATAAADNSGNTSGGGKIVCTAMNQQYGFGSFRNAIWLKYAENNLTKAHEAGYHAIFLPLVDFAFKQGDGKLNMLTRKFLENCARHRSLDLRAEMRGTKRDTIGMIYRSVLEPLCYAVGKFKGY